MPRLPIPGADDNVWGNILNDFLATEHNPDGSLKKAPLITQAQSDAAQALSTANSAQAVVAGKLDASEKGAPNGVAALDSNGQLNITNIPDLSALYLALGQGVTIASADGSGQPWKLIAMQDGSVKAVPLSATAPAAPTNLTGAIHLTFVKLTWDSVADATSYRLYRDGSLLSTLSDIKYTDATVQVNNTYAYTVVAVNQYGMWSEASTPFSADIAASLNVAPTLSAITIWPANPKPNDVIYVRVNASDVDTQQLALTLGVDAGTLSTTFDPSTWIWEGV